MKSIKNRLIFSFLFFIAIPMVVCAQSGLDRALRTWNKESVPYIYPENLPMPDSILYLDTREKEEFDVSHLKDALWVGYKDFDVAQALREIPDKSQAIIVYCSIGVRSENIGEKLKSLGYEKVLNLYGGIFQWKNQGGEVYNGNGMPTDSVHAFNKHWGKLLRKGVKVY
ncbi:rhodanese-like domain-containing protein [Maribacter sp. X9]|uniref:rhodanese-like domain-containing protein n=1 Tax=Maribacter sp. X9 TaxID=3402159 RepID=UPI003AF37D3E